MKWYLQLPVDNSTIGSVVRKKKVVNKRQWRHPVYGAQSEVYMERLQICNGTVSFQNSSGYKQHNST